MKKFIKIFLVVINSKIVLKNPKNYNLVFYDGLLLKNFRNILNKHEFFTLENRFDRINKIYITFSIIKFFIKYYNGNIATTYFIALLEVIKPKIVITYTDNDFKFSEIAKILRNKIKFIAVQNAYRADILEHNYLYKKKINKNLLKKFYIPNFLCHGNFDINIYKKFKIKVDNFYKVGSLRFSNFYDYNYHYLKKKINNFYDICLISDTTYERNKYLKINTFEEKIAQTTKYTIDFCKKKKLKFIFILKHRKSEKIPHKQELNFYKKHLNTEQFKYLLKNSSVNNLYSNYTYAIESKVTVGIISTMLGEKLSIGGKILSCNMTNLDIYNFPIKGVCSINDCKFIDFERRLEKILKMSKNKYFSCINKDQKYLINYDPNLSCSLKIKKIINENLK
jgi:surface carbohydrate biosynthesis protein